MIKKLLFGCIFLSQLTCDGNKKTNSNDAQPIISVKFSPKGGITQSIVKEIDDSTASVHVAAFSFTSQPIAEALVRAATKGTVQVILDRENLGNKSSVIHLLHKHHVSIFIDDKHAIAHNKIIIVDLQRVFTGSYNFTVSAEERNAENSVLLIDSRIASLYYDNWVSHKEHSYAYEPE